MYTVAVKAERAMQAQDDHDTRKLRFPDRMKYVQKNKDEGTELFKGGNFLHARERYVRALAHSGKFIDLTEGNHSTRPF